MLAEVTVLTTTAIDVSPSKSQMGQRHHLATNKHKSLYTRQFRRIFAKAGMSLNHALNLVLLADHTGRHSPRYHQWVLESLTMATDGLKGAAYRQALCAELLTLREEVLANPQLLKGVGL